MAFRNPNGPPPGAVGYGMLPYHQQMYMPGNMNMGLPGQQQQPRPGGGQYVQQRAVFPGMAPQRYPIMQQGMAPQQPGFQPQMFPGQALPQQQGVNIPQQMPFQQQQQQQQMFPGQPQAMPSHMQQQQLYHPSHQTQAANKQQKSEEQAKKERYFQEQQRKLKQFGRVGGKAASVDSLNINLDEMFGKGGGGKLGGARKEAGKSKQGGGAEGHVQPSKTNTAEDDGFGDFLQAPTPPTNTPASTPASTPANTPQTPEAGPLAPLGQTRPLAKDDGFSEFQGGQRKGTAGAAQPKPLKQDKKVLSLESMMMDSADLTASSKTAKPFNQKKTLRETEPASQAHRQQTFSKGKPWSSAENVTSMFTMPDTPGQSGGGLVEHGQGLQAGSSIMASQGGEGKGVPAWCMNEATLPLVYRQVLEASIRDGQIETSLLYPILILSGLDKPVLGHIWGLANQTIPGQLTRLELYIVLGLIALVQNGQQPSIEALHHFREAPLPILTPKTQSGPQTNVQSPLQPSNPPLASSVTAAGEDDFAPFQEAPGTKPSKSNASGPKPDRDQPFSKSSFGSPLFSDKRKPTDDSLKHEDLSMDSMLKFPKEEENCYIFAGSPADSSSGRSSPLVWDPNSIYDKLTCRSQESVSSGSLSDRTPGEEDEDDDDDDEDDFHDFKSAPKPAKTSNPTHLPSFPSIAPPKGSSTGTPASIGSASAKQSKFASSGMHSFDSLSQKKAASPRGDQQKIDLFHMDFEKVFPKVGRKTVSTNDFGSLQMGHSGTGGKAKEDDEFGDFACFKHSASESDLMGMQPEESDKYAAFRDLTPAVPKNPDTPAAVQGDEFDDFKQAEPPKDTLSAAPQIPSAGSLVMEAAQPVPGFTANFQDAYPSSSAQPLPPTSVFEPSPALPTINLSSSLPDSDGFADFKQAARLPLSSSDQRGDAFNLKADSISTSSSDDKYNVFRSLGDVGDQEPPEDDFGNFQTNPPPQVMDSLSAAPFSSKPEDNNGSMKKPVSASDLYGMEFDAFGSVNNSSVAMLNLEDAGENEPTDEMESTPTEAPFLAYNSFQSSQNSKLSKLESIDRLDLKTFDLDLTLGRSAAADNKDRADSFGEFSSAPTDLTSPVESVDQAMQQASDPSTPSGSIVPSQGVSTVPLVPAGSSLIGDRYAEVVGNVDDENRHANEWQRCLEKCHESVKKANNIFNNISSSSICNEVIKSSEGAEYLTAVIEIYRVACRILTSMNAMGVDSTELQRLQKDIELVWTNLSAFLASSTLMPAAGSFVFKTAVLRPEPTNTERACGVCLLNVDSRSKAFDHSKDSHKLVYGGRQYHATCANLWVNMVDSILPALPLNRLL